MPTQVAYSKGSGVQGILKPIRDVPKLLTRLKSTQTLLNPKDFSLLLDCIANLVLLRDLILSLGAELERIQRHNVQGAH